MENFKARTEGINDARLDDAMFVESQGVVPAKTLKPGIPLIMNEDGRYELLGATTVSLANKHLVYYCNSWADAVSKFGNAMVSAIPITKQFEFEMTFEAGDSFLEPGAELVVGDLICITSGKLALAETQGDYVIGSVKAGSATADLGGTITVVTWGGDYVIPA